MAEATIAVHQTVHGYRAGHELLQTSTQLTPDVQRVMLVQSDLSGPAVAPGFEEYLSGYPLDAAGVYVLARTWYAREMERPGCVWTHSLLISYADLPLLSSLAVLLRQFKRPLRMKSKVDVLPVLSVSLAEKAVDVADQALAAAPSIMSALYDYPQQPVVLFSEQSSDYETLALALWSQQWPRLRRNFRFCTGALSSRAREKNPFDLLIAPTALRSSIQRELPTGRFVDAVGEAAVSTWVAAGVRDLRGEQIGLREFLWAYGADTALPREAWRPLVQAFDRLRGATTAPITEIINLLGDGFPAADSGRRLKGDVLGLDTKFGKGADGSRELEVLRSLSTTPYFQSFAEVDLRLKTRARALWDRDLAAASELLQSLFLAPLNVFGEEILRELCDSVTPYVAVELERAQHGILSVLVERNPALATSATIWKVPFDQQRELLDVLARSGEQAVRSGVGAMLAAGTDELATDVARVLGDETVKAVLDAIDADAELSTRRLGQGWSDVLSRDPRRVIAWLQRSAVGGSRFAFAMSHLSPQLPEVLSVPAGDWLSLAGNSLESMHGSMRLRSAAFLLAIGLVSDTASGVELISHAYSHVYRVAVGDQIPYEIWRWLNDALPARHWWRQWDRCERLSLGIVHRFARFEWPLDSFFQAVSDPEALRQALDVANDSRKTRELLRRIRKELARGNLRLTGAQLSVLKSCL